ncbi:MAG: T9SS type A sorting domain-containing protein [Flavobacterium sp.]|nr:T9SS type A sorting domain-containing protein [Flavobacterium sp.]
MYTYNNVSSSWSSVGNTLSNSLSAGTAYRMLIRGDRSINLNSNTPTATTTILRATGQLHVGDFTISSNNLNQTSNSYSFIGNPYQSKVNMKEVLKGSGFQNQVWYWNSRVGSRGAYVSVDFTGDNDLVISGVGNSRIVAPGAAFFIRKQGSTTSSIVFKEAHKLSTTSDASVFRQQAREASNFDKINIALYDRNSALSNTILDGLLLVFKSGLNSELDPTDMPKIPNLDEDLFVNYENSAISIDKRNYPDIAEIIQLGIAKYRYTAYKLVFDLTQYSNLTPYLFDDHLNSYVQLQPGTINTYNFDVNPQIVSSINQSRFKIVYQPSNLSSEDFWNDIAIYPNPTKIGNQLYIKGITDGEIIVYNMLGQKIPTQITTIENSMQVMPLGNIQKGVYFVTILAQGKQKQLKWIIE